MTVCTKSSPTRPTRTALLVAALALAICAQARAESISYSLVMCESLEVLRNPTNKTLAMNEAWKAQHTLMLERTMPYFELRNTSEDAMITRMSISIGDVSRNFDWGKLIEASPGVAFSLITPDDVVGGGKADTLVIDFAGLAPGDFVRFRAGISPDDPSEGIIQDYRMTLFHLDGDDVSANSLVTVDFEGSGGEESLEQQMPNFAMGMPTATNMGFFNHYMDSVMPFTLNGQGTLGSGGDGGTGGDGGDGDVGGEGGPPEVPEPGSFILLAGGLVGLALWRIRRPRRTADV